MYEGRNLKNEIEELGIITMEDIGFGSRDSAFAALDAIREHNKQFPAEKLVEMNDKALKEAYANMSGTGNTGN